MQIVREEGLNVLSLFDGISCGQIALNRNNIKINNYFASEINKSAIKITQTNYPNTIQIGDVRTISYKNGVLFSNNTPIFTGKIDLLLGGSPCTDFSTIGYCKGMTTGEIEIVSLDQYIKLKNKNTEFFGESFLFWEYIRLLNEIKPQYFLLENVVMARKWLDLLNKTVGVEAIMINSELVSAQQRKRYYWTNIPNVKIPKNKNILFSDIIDKNADTTDKSYAVTIKKNIEIIYNKYGYVPEMFNPYNKREIVNKAPTLTKGSLISSSCAVMIFVPTKKGIHIVKNGILNKKYKVKFADGKYNLRRMSIKELERLQTLPDDYTNIVGVSNSQRENAIGNGWTVDIIKEIVKEIA